MRNSSKKIGTILRAVVLFVIFMTTGLYYFIIAAYSSYVELVYFFAIWTVLIFHPFVTKRRHLVVALICGLAFAVPIGSMKLWISEFRDMGFHNGLMQFFNRDDFSRHSWMLLFFVLALLANEALGYLTDYDLIYGTKPPHRLR